MTERSLTFPTGGASSSTGGKQLKRNPIFGALIALVLVLTACDPPPPQSRGPEFDSGDLAGYEIENPTAIAIGPDGRLYVSSLEGRVDALTLDGTTVAEVENIATEADNGQILGLAVREESGSPAVYLSENFINGASNGDPFPNRIIRIGGSDWSERSVVVSGLPVSGHNHGTNALAFGADGRLYISQGGTTSSGAPSGPEDDRWLGWDETPLSGAILVADIDAPGFDGAVTYDRSDASAGTRQVSGDVAVWSPGHRNTYGMVFHSNGNLYAIDNGSSEPLPASADCDTLERPPDNDPDQLNLVVPEVYYGHPNRSRGQTDPGECVYIAPDDEDVDSNMLKLLPPSSNAIIEFRGGGAFDGEWDGDLIYGWWTGGEIRRLVMGDDGRTIEGEELLAEDLAAPIAMVQDATGTIFIAEFSGGISFLKPEE